MNSLSKRRRSNLFMGRRPCGSILVRERVDDSFLLNDL